MLKKKILICVFVVKGDRLSILETIIRDPCPTIKPNPHL